MRELLFRGKRTNNGEWVEGSYVFQYGCHEIYLPSCESEYGFDHYSVDPATVSQFTGLQDKNGKRIWEGDVLRFDDNDGVWQSFVVFERGLFGLDVCYPKQIKNPEGWDKSYDRIKSRWWGSAWGYEEYGTAFTYRQPLAKATVFKGNADEYQNSDIKKWHEKHGFDKYVVWAEAIGNKWDNPELLEGGRGNG